MRLLSTSEDESEENYQNIETSLDGIGCEQIATGFMRGRSSLCSLFREESGSTECAKRNIMKAKLKTAFSLIIDHCIMKHIENAQ